MISARTATFRTTIFSFGLEWVCIRSLWVKIGPLFETIQTLSDVIHWPVFVLMFFEEMSSTPCPSWNITCIINKYPPNNGMHDVTASHCLEEIFLGLYC